jgi:hypothetical protein
MSYKIDITTCKIDNIAAASNMSAHLAAEIWLLHASIRHACDEAAVA